MATLDIFNDDAFSLTRLTLAINDVPYEPMRLRQLNLFREEGITTTAVMLEKTGTAIELVPAAARGAPPFPVAGDRRQMVPFSAVHLPERATVMADEVQGIRTFGSETELETVQAIVNKRLRKMRRNLDVTLEWQRMGAIRGQILDSDGTTVLLDLASTFGVTQQVVPLALSDAALKVREKIVNISRLVEETLGGLAYTGIRVLCSPSFFQALVGHPAVEAAYERWQDGEFLRMDVRPGFRFAGVYWEEYRGQVGGIKFIADGEAYAIPEGVSDLFVTYYAPADYVETVNTIGLPYYAKQELLRMGKGIEIESQSNPISICTRPRAVIKLTL